MRLIDADALKESIGCADAVKYGNKTADQRNNSYSTMMMYEIADYIDDMPTVDAEPVVRCKECKSYQNGFCENVDSIMDGVYRVAFAVKRPDDFCSYGEKED